MTSSVLNAWNLDPDQETLAYHLRHAEREESTLAFADFIAPFVTFNAVLDIGCGAGGATAALQQRFRLTRFSGMDISKRLISIANLTYPNISFSTGDACRLRKLLPFDGVVSLQTFSWMPNIERPLEQICQKINPRWLAFSSLFYEGDISAKIVVDEPKRPRRSYYNVYSIPRTASFMQTQGYKIAGLKPFTLHAELPKPDNPDIMKTWTHRGLQFSGPLYLPWWFLAFERIPPWE